MPSTTLSAKTPNDLLDRYFTLTEWSTAVAAAGAEVSVVQRFHTAATIERDGIRYEFVTDKLPPWLSTRGAPPPFITAIVKEAPDVVHVNGLIFPGLVAEIRGKAKPGTVIVAQHHGGEFPIRGSGLSGIWLSALVAHGGVAGWRRPMRFHSRQPNRLSPGGPPACSLVSA